MVVSCRRLVALFFVCLAAPATASTGGVSADAAPGGAGDPRKTGAIVYGAPAPPRPVARVFRVTRSVREGRLPTVRFRIDEPGVRVVTARLVVVGADRSVPARVTIGRIRTGRLRTLRWPRRT